MEAEGHNPELVPVTVAIVDENGNTRTEHKTIPEEPTKVPELKVELGVPAADALWLIRKNGRKHELPDHGTHVVEERDHYEAIPRGGVS